MPRILFALLLVLLSGSAAIAKDVQEERAEIREASQKILDELYETSPEARKLIANSAGYATFSNFGMKIFFAGGGSGKGLAVNNRTKSEIFMKMLEVQAGLGIGIKKFYLVFVFDDERALTDFVESGWASSAQTSAAATDGEIGEAYQGAITIAPGVRLFQLTDKGLALEATVKETKYYRDDDLN